MRKRSHEPTDLERLIEQSTADALVARLRVTAEHLGDELAKELLADEEFRRAIKELARATAQRVLERLSGKEE
jgi:hypothetical protein